MTNPIRRVTDDGTEHWRFDTNGRLHRDNGPAIIKLDGHREWWINGELHRLDGPAVIHQDGTESWFARGDYLGSTVHAFLLHVKIQYPDIKLNSEQRMALLMRWG